MGQIKNIYLAGKVFSTTDEGENETFQLNDWRETIVKGNLRITDPWFYRAGKRNWPILEGAILDKYNYVGPFFVGNADNHDHCFSPGTHGKGDLSNTQHSNDIGNYDNIFHSCMEAIKKADLVFAWIDSKTCYGTLIELGYAKGLGKDIIISGSVSLDDLWFAYRTSDKAPFWTLEGPASVLKNYLLVEDMSPIEKQFWSAWGQMVEEINIVPQYEIFGGRYRVDFAHLGTKTAIELDGLEAHSTTEQIAKDRRRQREIEADGWRFIRFGGKEVYHNVEDCVLETRDFINKALPKPFDFQDKEFYIPNDQDLDGCNIGKDEDGPEWAKDLFSSLGVPKARIPLPRPPTPLVKTSNEQDLFLDMEPELSDVVVAWNRLKTNLPPLSEMKKDLEWANPIGINGHRVSIGFEDQEGYESIHHDAAKISRIEDLLSGLLACTIILKILPLPPKPKPLVPLKSVPKDEELTRRAAQLFNARIVD